MKFAWYAGVTCLMLGVQLTPPGDWSMSGRVTVAIAFLFWTLTRRRCLEGPDHG